MTDSNATLFPDQKGIERHINRFNCLYEETVVNAVPDREASDWIRDNVPLFECSDEAIEEIYYFRWWIYRKHIKHTPDGFVITEFLPEVKHGGKHNTINCPVGHHIYEGRWIRNPQYIDEYCEFMLRKGGDLHSYTCWFADPVYKRYCANSRLDFMTGLIQELKQYYIRWEERKTDGLFHHTPWMDGMEYSISGSQEERFRPSFNSYMYGDASALSNIARLSGDNAMADDFSRKASSLKERFQSYLWDTELNFFITRDLEGNSMPSDMTVREAVGFIPWYFNLPDPGYETAWHDLSSPSGFCTPVGLTTAEIKHPLFLKLNPGRIASWDGAIWPFATSQTLTAIANLIRNYDQSLLTRTDYFRELRKYALSHRNNGNPGICEVIRDPYLAEMKGSEHYNHSTFCDLVITGLAGLVPREDNMLEINPLAPEDMDYFCLGGVLYHDRMITVLWDGTGYRTGKRGFRVLADGEIVFSAEKITHVLKDMDCFAQNKSHA